MSATSLPLVPALRPAWTDSLPRKAAIVLAGSLALAISAQIAVPMWPVPITGQTLVVLLLGFAFGPRLGASSVATYIVGGAAGLPVFQGFASGTGVLTGTTAGYLVGMIFAAALTGVLAERGWHESKGMTVAGMALGNLVIYLFGATWLSTIAGWNVAITGGVLPFLVGDAVKIAIAVALLPTLAAKANR